MTYEEAIERLSDRYCTVSKCIDANQARKENLAIDMAVEALERQIRMKPITRTVDRGLIVTVCPICGVDTPYPREIECGDTFCPDCGQAIDWSFE